jgi:hypothetical protein
LLRAVLAHKQEFKDAGVSVAPCIHNLLKPFLCGSDAPGLQASTSQEKVSPEPEGKRRRRWSADAL